MTNRIWYNGIEDLIIDCMYSFTKTVTDAVARADSGIVLYNSPDITVRKYYCIFVQKTLNNIQLGILYQHYFILFYFVFFYVCSVQIWLRLYPVTYLY